MPDWNPHTSICTETFSIWPETEQEKAYHKEGQGARWRRILSTGVWNVISTPHILTPSFFFSSCMKKHCWRSIDYRVNLDHWLEGEDFNRKGEQEVKKIVSCTESCIQFHSMLFRVDLRINQTVYCPLPKTINLSWKWSYIKVLFETKTVLRSTEANLSLEKYVQGTVDNQ